MLRMVALRKTRSHSALKTIVSRSFQDVCLSAYDYKYIHICMCRYVYMYVCMYACMYMYTYIHIMYVKSFLRRSQASGGWSAGEDPPCRKKTLRTHEMFQI